MLVVVTGVPGVGKTTLLARLNHPQTIIMDEIVHQTWYIPGHPLVKELTAEFGSQILQPEGTINRQTLGEIIFANKYALKKLNAITTPYFAAYFNALSGFHLIEMGSYLSQEDVFKKFFTKVILITTTRPMSNDKFSYLAQVPQLSIPNKIVFDYHIINNDFDSALTQLRTIVMHLN